MPRSLRETAHRLCIALLCMILSAGQVFAGSMTLLGAGGPAAGAIVFSLAWVSHSENSAGGTIITYSAVSFGTADPNRIIAVAGANRGNAANASTASMTIGGIAATQVASAVANDTTNFWASDVWQAAVPTGTSGNVVITYTNASLRSGIDLYRIVTGHPTATSANGAFTASNSTTNTAQSTTVTVPTGGSALTIYGNRAQTTIGQNVNFTNATLDHSEDNIGAVNTTVASGTTTTTGSVTITGQIASSGGPISTVQSSAAWGP